MTRVLEFVEFGIGPKVPCTIRTLVAQSFESSRHNVFVARCLDVFSLSLPGWRGPFSVARVPTEAVQIRYPKFSRRRALPSVGMLAGWPSSGGKDCKDLASFAGFLPLRAADLVS